MKRIEEMSLWERVYFPEIIRGLMVTGYRFWRNLAIHCLQKVGLAQRPSSRDHGAVPRRARAVS